MQQVRAAYITFCPDLAFPGATEAIGAFSTLAAHKGVQHLVLLSGRGEEEAEASERAVQSAGTGWTIVRCAWFNQNFDESFLLEPVRYGDIALPAGDMAEPFTDVLDGRNAHVADGVRQALGREPRDFADYARMAAATGVWDA